MRVNHGLHEFCKTNEKLKKHLVSALDKLYRQYLIAISYLQVANQNLFR